MDDRGHLGRELVRIVENARNHPAALRRAAALRGIEPARHTAPSSPGEQVRPPRAAQRSTSRS